MTYFSPKKAIKPTFVRKPAPLSRTEIKMEKGVINNVCTTGYNIRLTQRLKSAYFEIFSSHCRSLRGCSPRIFFAFGANSAPKFQLFRILAHYVGIISTFFMPQFIAETS